MGTVWWITALFGYLLLVRFLRYRNRNDSVRTLRDTIKAAGSLNPDLAQKIMIRMPMYETPFMAALSMTVALFQSYGIPSIASLLIRTGQLGNQNAGKRLADTSILIGHFVFLPINAIKGSNTDPRGVLSLARVNWLHRQHKIKNEDMLYLLSKFLYEPIEWNERFEWRGWTLEEKQACFIFWKCVGERMGIHSIPETYEEYRDWTEEYERDNMKLCKATKQLGAQSFEYALDKLPDINLVRKVGRKLLVALMPDRLRVAMGFPEPSPILLRLVHGLLYTRAFMIRHLFLPRMKAYDFTPMDVREPSIWAVPSSEDPMGSRMHSHTRKREPYYYPSLTGRRIYAERILIWLGLKEEKYLPGPRYYCGGYKIEELGPTEKAKSGHEEVFREASEFFGSKIDRDWTSRFRPNAN